MSCEAFLLALAAREQADWQTAWVLDGRTVDWLEEHGGISAMWRLLDGWMMNGGIRLMHSGHWGDGFALSLLRGGESKDMRWMGLGF